MLDLSISWNNDRMLMNRFVEVSRQVHAGDASSPVVASKKTVRRALFRISDIPKRVSDYPMADVLTASRAAPGEYDYNG